MSACGRDPSCSETRRCPCGDEVRTEDEKAANRLRLAALSDSLTQVRSRAATQSQQEATFVGRVLGHLGFNLEGA